MTKMDLVKNISKEMKVTQDQAKEFLDTFIEVVTDGLKEDNNVQITGFGTFKLKHVAEREGHNPKNTEEKIMIPARNQVSFTSGAQLKADVNTSSPKKTSGEGKKAVVSGGKKKIIKKKK